MNNTYACLFNLAWRIPKYMGNSEEENAFIYDFHLFLLFSFVWLTHKKYMSIHNAVHVTITMPSTLIISELCTISKQVNIWCLGSLNDYVWQLYLTQRWCWQMQKDPFLRVIEVNIPWHPPYDRQGIKHFSCIFSLNTSISLMMWILLSLPLYVAWENCIKFVP